MTVWRKLLFTLTVVLVSMLHVVAGSAEDGVTDVASASAAIQQWEVILGFIQPLLIAFIIQSSWSRSTQSVVSFLAAAATTTIGMWLQGDFNGVTDWVTSVMTVFAVSMTSYYGVWKPTGVAPKIEVATSPGT